MRLPLFCLLSIAALTPVVVAAPASASEATAAAVYPDISKAELDQAIAAKQVTLLDCNGSGSYAKGHIPGAIDFDVAEKDLAAHLPKDKGTLVVAYCGGPGCNAYRSGAKAAAALGYTNVKHFSAGITGWKSANGPIE